MDMLEGSLETGHVLIFFLETEMKNVSVMMNKHKIVNSTVLVRYNIHNNYVMTSFVQSQKLDALLPYLIVIHVYIRLSNIDTRNNMGLDFST